MRALIYISVGMTLARFLMAIVAAREIAVNRENALLILILFILIVTLDVFDGVVYRKSGREDTGFRRKLDSVIDKITILLVAFATMFATKAFGFVLVSLLPELIIATISVLAYLQNHILKPNIFGKLSCVAFAFFCAGLLYFRAPFVYATFGSFLILSALAIINYLKQYQSRKN